VCAVVASDEETCVTVARYFMKEYQFTTDSYRLFAAISRVCQSPVSWYSSGPSQKFILRQIKAMDFGLVDKEQQELHYTDRGSYSTKDQSGNPLVNDDMDIELLMLYGHILYTGTSYNYALSEFTQLSDEIDC
jgi:general transcription factor 3C polypeptide 3 (transcription factor C subunit 4)